jgi:hypothetical protein
MKIATIKRIGVIKGVLEVGAVVGDNVGIYVIIEIIYFNLFKE